MVELLMQIAIGAIFLFGPLLLAWIVEVKHG